MSASENNQRIRLVLRSDLQVEIRDFLIDRQARGLSPKTVAWYRQKLEVVRYQLESLGVAQVVDIRPTTVRALLLALGQTHNPGGVHGFYRALRAFLRWWEVEVEPEGWSNPLAKVRPPRVDEPPLEPVSIDDLQAMLATCQRRRFYGERDRALMLFLLDSGLRRAEFQALNVGHVNLDNGSVVVIRGKGGKPRTAFIGAKTRRALARYLRFRPDATDADPLWVTRQGRRLSYNGLREVLRRRALRAGVPEPSLHAFRRGFAISALRAGCDLITLQRMLGHSSLAVVSRYLKQVENDLREAHQRVGPVDHLL
jgi:site-specific recombinase XerD